MKTFLYLLLLLITQFFEPIQGQCSGGIWPIQDAAIGSFTVSWRYNMASNTVQFIIQGQAISSINLASTYIALGWSDTAPTMDNIDIAMYFPGTEIVQDRYARAHVVPSVDSQQDFCVIRTNITNQNVYVAFERFLTTGDVNDISFISNVYLMFSMGPYTSNGANSFNPQYHFFRIPFQTSISLISCVSTGCLTTSCTTASCPCLQQITSGSAQCICFPPSSCVSGSTITPKTTISTLSTSPMSATINGSCQNSCSSNGICLQTSATQFLCQCKNNYTGVLCQTSLLSTNLTNTNQCQCVNGGTCLANGTCLCTNNYRGKFCQLNNSCIGYCHNNGICSIICADTSCSAPTCMCANGYTGLQCDTLLGGACQSNPCAYGNCTIAINGGFQCQCNNAYSGVRCDSLNVCISNPCNQGTCIQSSNCLAPICGYSCVCPNGTTGTNCEIGANLCWNSPCKNGGACSVLLNSYVCQCLLPYGGTNCDLIINVCTPNPCLNNGVCIRNSNMQNGVYSCQCTLGYIGAKCEYLSGCISSPCRNGGQCISRTTNCSSTTCVAKCLCLSGTTGVYCEQQNTVCSTISCLNGGTCLINPLTNIPYCQCPTNVIGARCETLQPICTTTTCSNNGVCFIDASSGNNTLKCICYQSFTGQYCQSSLNPTSSCTQNPCGYNGTCFPTSNSSYYCICPNGQIGQSCNATTLTSCSGSPCRYLSTCQQILNTNPVSFKCVCPDYLTGDRCQYTNNCERQPCFNQGSCIPLGSQNNFMCLCQPGFGNYDCSIYLDLSCSSSVCSNGGTCSYNNTNIRCICPPSFTGARCEWTSVCSTNTCLNGGTCRQIAATMAECLCATGFTGTTCNLRDSCANFPCKNGAGCTNLLTDTSTGWSAYRCTCPLGFYGQNCETTISACSSTICSSPKICSEQSSGPICTCSGNKVGTFCQYDNPCGLSPTTYCSNGGTCVSSNTDPPVASCLCPSGFTGSRCNRTTQNDPCASNPCQASGYCALSTLNITYTCVCQTNYVGNQCERASPCSSSPCLNQAICQANWNITNTWYICRCVGTFTGTRCETSLLNPCSGLCMNGSPCINGVCVCPAQYTGAFCGFNNPCYNSICRNGGFCSPNFNSTSVSFTCTCPSPYTGQYCEIAIPMALSTSCIATCMNGGSCSYGVCVCTSQYVGPLCQYENPCIKNNSCLNGATCFGRYSTNGSLYTQCFCLQGYTGIYCEATLCSSTSCNGGSCIASQNTIVCICPTGKVGDRCQYADACANHPCLPTERCDQTGNHYQCTSCYDQSTFCSSYQLRNEYCNNGYTLLINTTFLPVPQACQLSCGQCVQRLSDARLSSEMSDSNLTLINSTWIDDDYTTESMISSTTTTTTTTTRTTTTSELNMVFSRSEKCFDKRDDCLMQKAYGFCDIFNEKYPDECVETCNPDCAIHS